MQVKNQKYLPRSAEVRCTERPQEMERVGHAGQMGDGEDGGQSVGSDRRPELPKRAAIKILQCNNELCQYEQRLDGDIESVSQSKKTLKMKLEVAPRLCLIIKKPNAPQLQQPLRDVANFMHNELKLNVCVEPAVKADYPDLPFLVSVGPPPQPFSDFHGNASSSPLRYDQETLKAVDFVVCLGGDGTILWVSGLYNGPCPPIISFAMGSLGFLTPFNFDEYREVIAKTAAGDVEIGIRTRLLACVHDDMNRKIQNYVCLNEVSVDRGPSPLLTEIECYCDDRYVTTAHGDGVIVATPTGSTAYSLAAGGSMVHPDVPGMLLTPICAHMLAFRPFVFPDSVTLRLQQPITALFPAWCSFDGKNAIALNKGWSVSIFTSKVLSLLALLVQQYLYSYKY